LKIGPQDLNSVAVLPRWFRGLGVGWYRT